MKRKNAVKSGEKTKKRKTKKKKVENILVDKSTDLLLRSEILEMCHKRGTEKSC